MGLITLALSRIIQKRRLQVVEVTALSLFYLDAEHTPENYQRIVDYSIKALEKNQAGILVLHDGCQRIYPVPEEAYYDKNYPANRSWAPTALEYIISYFLAKGYTFDIDF